MVGNPRFRKRKKPPTDKRLRKEYDWAMRTKRIRRNTLIIETFQPILVQSARKKILRAYREEGITAAEEEYTECIRKLNQMKGISPKETEPVRENLDSFINAIRKKANPAN